MTLNDLFAWLEETEGGTRSIRSLEDVRDLVIDLRAVVERCNPEAEEELQELQEKYNSLRDEFDDLRCDLSNERDEHADRETALMDEIQTLKDELEELKSSQGTIMRYRLTFNAKQLAELLRRYKQAGEEESVTLISLLPSLEALKLSGKIEDYSREEQ